MANGVAVCLSPAQAAPLRTIAPDDPVPASDISIEIGITTADCAVALSAAMLAFHETGRMTPEIKAAGTEKIARLAQLELDTLGEIEDFAGIVHREGLCRLRKLLDAEFFQAHGAAAGEAVLSNLISGVLEITQKVVALEKAFRAN